MRKIPTVFRRDPDDMKHVLPEVNPGCEWVLAGEGVATRKYDGTCCMYRVDGTWWARREVKPGKVDPPGFITADHDEVTGKTVGWVPMESSDFRKWWLEALGRGPWLSAPTYPEFTPGTYELIGPKVNGNPEGLDTHFLVAHATADRVDVDPIELTHAHLRGLLLSLGVDGVEGIVWHHPDGRMAKLKARDFS